MADAIDRPNLTEQLLQRIVDASEADIQDYTRLIHLAGMLREEINGERKIESELIIKERADCFKALMVRSEQVRAWQTELCCQLKIESFTLKYLESKIDANNFVRLSQAMSSVVASMTTLMELDADLKTLIERDLEGTKLELHRLQGGKRLRKVYYVQEDPEARFIDKEK